jgi:cellulose biosynthesis protein BcsQ
MADTRQAPLPPPPIIAVANPKGGSGKSTLAGNLAGIAAANGDRVLIADGDEDQGTATSVASRIKRRYELDSTEAASEGGPPQGPAVPVVKVDYGKAHTPEEVAGLTRIRGLYDIIIGDTPGSLAGPLGEIVRAMIRVSAVAVIPCEAAYAAIEPALRVIAIALEEGTPHLVVPNKLSPRYATAEHADLRALLTREEPRTAVARSGLRLYAAVPNAQKEGRHLIHYRGSNAEKAAADLAGVYGEVLAVMRRAGR